MPLTQPRIATIETWPITKLKLWDKNPRSISSERFAELKTRLQRQGQIKPLLITKEGLVIGGNMRLRAMKSLGWNEALVAIQNVSTEQEILDLALTDNEAFGQYDKEILAELAVNLGLELQDYHVTLEEPKPLDLIVNSLSPELSTSETEEGREEVCRQCSLHCGV